MKNRGRKSMKIKMKRQITLTIALGLTAFSTAFAAAVSPFDEVPEKNWTYNSMSRLAKSGVVDGYNDTSFTNGKILTRYEMAFLVAKVMSKVNKSDAAVKAETKTDLEKLEDEFSAELKNLGVRVPRQDGSISDVKFSGDARIRYQINPVLTATNKSSSNPSRLQERWDLNFTAPVSEKITFNGQIWTENRVLSRSVNSGTLVSENAGTMFDKGEFVWKNANTALTLGRFQPFLGQGIIFAGGPGNFMDGIYGTYKLDPRTAVSAGYADMGAEFENIGTSGLANLNGNQQSVKVSMQNVSYQVDSNATLTAAHMKVMNHPVFGTVPYNFDQYAVGGKVKTGEMTIIAEGVVNNADNLPANARTKGGWGRIQWKASDPKKPGTYQISADYLKFGNWAIDSTFWKIVLPVPGGNGIGGDGAKGFGLDFDYVVAKNLDVDVKYYKLKPYDSNASTFSSYEPYYGFITNWRF